MSEGESNGTIISPNFPNEYPPGLTCHYYIDGLMDKENLEKVELVFEHFDIPGADRNTYVCPKPANEYVISCQIQVSHVALK